MEQITPLLLLVTLPVPPNDFYFMGNSRFKPSYSEGFTLIELIAVIVIVSVIGISVSSRFYSADASQVQTSRDDVIAALFFAQQVAMARASNSNTVRFLFSSSQVSVEENGTPLNNGGVIYPLSLPANVSLSATRSGPYDFDKLGRTRAAVLTLSSGSSSSQIQLSASGYAY